MLDGITRHLELVHIKLLELSYLRTCYIQVKTSTEIQESALLVRLRVGVTLIIPGYMHERRYVIECESLRPDCLTQQRSPGAEMFLKYH